MHRKRICCNNTKKIIYQHFYEQYSKYNTSSRFLEQKKPCIAANHFFYTQVPAIIDAATPRSLPNSHLKNLERPLLFFRRYIVSLL